MFIDDSQPIAPAPSTWRPMDPERRRAFRAHKRARFWDISRSGRHLQGGRGDLAMTVAYDRAQPERARLEPTAAAHAAAGHSVLTASDGWKACETCGAPDLR